MMMFFFWVVTPCSLGGRYQRFGGTGPLMTEVETVNEIMEIKSTHAAAGSNERCFNSMD
jgi:hypothetical protein